MSDSPKKPDSDDTKPRSIPEFLKAFGPNPMMSGFSSATRKDEPDFDDDASTVDEDHEAALRRIREFNLKPREIRDYLNRFVIRQDEAKKVLSVAICDHFNHVRQCLESPNAAEVDYAKQNVILLGPTGVGKTYLLRCIAKLIGVPFAKADATKFSETGYVGNDADDLVRDLVKLANGDTELAQYGIIYVDEIDKIAGRGGREGGGRDVSGRGVQINLLKLMEETEVNLHSQTDIAGQMESLMQMMNGGGGGKPRKRTLNTRHILFIVSGAFGGLADRIRRRMKGAQIGFGHAVEPEDDGSAFLRHVQTRDLIDYGFEPEFIGRLPVRVVCEPLDAGDLEQILSQSGGSILAQYRRAFQGYGIELNVASDALHTIAEAGYKEQTGARGLMTVMERLFRDFKFELPSTSIDTLTIDGDTVADPAAHLERLLRETQQAQRAVLAKEVEAFAERFRLQYDLRLDFEADAVDAIVQESLDGGKTVRSLCDEKFHDLHYGLSLISRGTGETRFSITVELVREPDKTLSKWVVEHLRQDT